MNRKRHILLTLLLIASSAIAAPIEEIAITESTPFEGKGNVLVFKKDGTAQYMGRHGGTRLGRFTSRIAQEDYARLAALLSVTNVPELGPMDGAGISHRTTHTISIHSDKWQEWVLENPISTSQPLGLWTLFHAARGVDSSLEWLPSTTNSVSDKFSMIIIGKLEIEDQSLQETFEILQKATIDGDPEATGIAFFLLATPDKRNIMRISYHATRLSVREILNELRFTKGLEVEIRGDCAIIQAPKPDPWEN